jgi:large subunit ribosomal protein L15
MKLDEILKQAGKNKAKKRLGRGSGSGLGKTAGRGHKGYGSRSGSKATPGFEGGQNPAIARLPKRGFSNAKFKKTFQVVNVEDLDARFDDGATVDPAALAQAGLIGDADRPVKILGDGQLNKKLTVAVGKLSASAVKKIEDAGGSVQTD